MPITVNEIREAAATLQKYKQGKANLENRIIENEQWFKMTHWKQYKRNDGGKLPSSGWLFNSIANKHADAMDNYPEPAILPREESDIETAKVLSQVVPAVLEKNKYEKVYSDTWWYKLKQGTGVKGIFWDPVADDISIRRIDLLNLFWEPGVLDLQESENLFHVELVNHDVLNHAYPKLQLTTGDQSIQVSKYVYDESIDTSNKSAVIDWYYKKENANGDMVLHYCKFVDDNILFASENEKGYKDGFYHHGKYPFVVDPMFLEEGMPVGFGYIDAMKDAQETIDELDSNIQFNARLLAKPRYITKAGNGVNLEELADYSRDFIEIAGDTDTAIRQLPVQSLDASIIAYRDKKINELKEISGNRDFNQGSTAGGVTAASAISMLQEAGNKLSRDVIKSAYRAFSEECELIIELIRQFYNDERVFRITEPNGQHTFLHFDNSKLQPRQEAPLLGQEFEVRVPVFDIKVSAQKKSPFNQISHNQLVLQLYQMGFFNPQVLEQSIMALKLMDFDGKESILNSMSERLSQQIAMQQQLQQQAEQEAMLAQYQNMQYDPEANEDGNFDLNIEDILQGGTDIYDEGQVNA